LVTTVIRFGLGKEKHGKTLLSFAKNKTIPFGIMISWVKKHVKILDLSGTIVCNFVFKQQN